MRGGMAVAVALLAPAVALAAPEDKVDPVAEGYPDWHGVVARNHIAGREIGPSDLRHKLTIVVEVEATEKFAEHLTAASRVASQGVFGAKNGFPWDDSELPRDVISVISVRGEGGKSLAAVREVLSNKKSADKELCNAISRLGGPTGCPIYVGVTFTGAPDGTGRRPFAYVLGPEGKTPLYAGKLDAAGQTEALAAIAKGRKAMAARIPGWRQFYGYVAEPKFNVTLAKAIERGKSAKASPLAPVSKALLSDVKSKDAERAKEAQILFDAIEQTRSDLVQRIRLETPYSPVRAYCDIETLLKHWPQEKKSVEAVSAKLRADPEIEPIGKVYCKVREWSDPSFACKTAAEAKKIVQELGKMKKTVEKSKESKNIQVQNCAQRLDLRLDELVSSVPAKVAAK